MKPWALFVAFTLAAVGAVSIPGIGPAGAQAPPGGAGTPGGRSIQAEVRGDWTEHPGGPTGAVGAHCRWDDIDNMDPAMASATLDRLNAQAVDAWAPYYAEVGGAEPQPVVRWLTVHPLVSELKQFVKTCGGAETFVVVPVVTNTPGIAQLIPGDLKFKFMHRPVLDVSPRDAEFGWAYVHVPVAVRTTGRDWRSYSVTAENHNVPPSLYRFITVTATPLEFAVNADGGAGRTSCAGNAPIAPYVASGSVPCSLEFKHESSTSRTGTFGYHGEITWKVTYVSNFGPPGALADINLGTDGNLAVAAIKALVS